jgi:hypothetical protein
VGNAGDDILIAGTLDGPSDPIDRFDQMLGVLLDWNTFHSRPGIRRRLFVGGDASVDVLTGSAGDDWYFYDVLEDTATDRKSEAAEDIG